MRSVASKLCSLVFCFCFCSQAFLAKSQICQPDIFAVEYSGSAAYHAFHTIRTPEQDIVSVGSVLQVTNGFSEDAWVYKLSSRGTVLWAKRYMPSGYNSGYFNSVLALPNGSYLVAGRFSYQVRRFPDNQIEVVYSLTVLCTLDQFGNLTSMKMFNPFGTYFTSINSLTLLPNGDVLGAASAVGLNLQRQLIFRMGANGDIKWSFGLQSGETEVTTPVFRPLGSGQVMAGGWCFVTPPGGSRQQAYYLFLFNPETGRVSWSSIYQSASPSQNLSLSSVQNITEMPDGRISVFSSFSEGSGLTIFPNTESALHLQFTAGGNLQKAIAYQNGQPGCAVIDAQPANNGGHLLLLNAVDMPVLASVDAEGNIGWQRGFGKVNGNLKANSVFPGNGNLQLYFSGRQQVAMSGLLQTEENGALACMETNPSLSSREVTGLFGTENAGFFTEAFHSDVPLFTATALGLNRRPYTLNATVSCVVSCCNDILSDTTRIALCNTGSWDLPGGVQVRESGTYYTRHKTRAGCDSIAYYDVQLDRSPTISLGADLCLEDKDSVVIRATGGFDEYNWMGSNRSDSTFVTRQPGSYWVRVANHCGIGADTVQVFRDCDFPVYMPNAFTPNGDGRNDVFRYPPSAGNKFISLHIFNRWGQKIFESRNAATGWNGRVNGTTQPADTYVYVLETETLNGRKRIHKGNVTLIR